MKPKKIISYLLNILITILCLVSMTVVSYYVFKLNIIPKKYLIPGYVVLLLVVLLMVFNIFRKSKIVTKILSFVFILFISVGCIFVTNYFKNTYQFLNGAIVQDYDTLTYSVIVLKDRGYSQLKDLEEKTISYLQDDYSDDITSYLGGKISYQKNLLEEFGVLPDQLLEKQTEAICLEESYFTLIKEEVEDFEESTQVIDTFEVRVKAHQEETNSIEISKDSFIVYISGIDQYGNVNSVRGRSDVNQIAVVNPKTNHILLVNTPRDYYIQLAGTTGLKDKLTHAGIYGIGKSISTLESLYRIDIDHYLRVNFDTLIKVVDIIGGIDIYSDASFTCWTNRSVHVEKGWNHFNGKEALAYSRERYAYITGDHHRGANQQQVITTIIQKVTQSNVLISKYNSILNTLNGSFQTDMSMNMITSFIKYQLDKMPSWNVESIAATGFNSSNYTYSMGTNYKLYVMEPDMSSVNRASTRIQEVYNEE